MGNAKSVVTEPDGSDTTYRWPFLKQIATVRLILGPITAVLAWIAAFQLIPTNYVPIGIMLLFMAFPTTLLEFSRIISKCTFCPAEGTFCKIWHFFLRLDTWKRGAFYILVTLLCFILASGAPFAIIMGICYVVLAICYTLKTFQHTPPEQVVAAGMVYAGNQAGAQSNYGVQVAAASVDSRGFSTIPP